MDELWSYGQSKAKRVWIWLAIERQTRKIVGIAFGNRTEETCLELWASPPANYRQRAVCITDGLACYCYAAVLPAKRHRKGRTSPKFANSISPRSNGGCQWELQQESNWL